jgi:hypothetical protein
MQLATQQLDTIGMVGQLAALARQDMPVAVRNQLPGIATFTDENTKINMIWQAHGDPNGGDVKEVHPSMLLNPQFRENVLRGIYTVESDPDVLNNALMLQRHGWDQRQAETANAAAQIQSAADQTVATGVSCIAPKGPRELCGVYAMVEEGSDPNSKPPLCAEHLHLARLYVPSPTGRQVNGKDEIIWKRG